MWRISKVVLQKDFDRLKDLFSQINMENITLLKT